VILSAFLFFYGLGDRDLWSSHEGRAAQDAQTIIDDGSWGLPHHFDRRLELQKPPLYYWLVAGAARLLGRPVDAWLVRLPAATAGVAGVLLLYLLAASFRRPVVGFVAGGVLATAQHYTWMSRLGRIDMPLTLALGVALGMFYLGYRRSCDRVGRSGWPCFAGAYIALAFAAMLKGPIGVVLAAAVVLAFLLVEGALPLPWQYRSWLALAHQLGVWWGLPLVLALAGPWFVWAGIQTKGSLLWTFIWHHNVERAFGGGTLRAHPWWFYGPRLAVDLFPWSLLLPVACWSFCSAGRASQQDRAAGLKGDREARFGLIWLTAMVLVMSCLRFKRADYLVPAYPGAALFLGCIAEKWYQAARRPKRLAAAWGLVILACAGGWAWYVDRVLPAAEPTLEQQRFAREIRQLVPAPELVLFFRVEAHALAFHVGSPIDTFLEWENLDIWAGRPGTHYIVMPPDCAAEWPKHVTAGRLEEVLRNTSLPGATHHEHPLVLLRTIPGLPRATP
jgi:4-amino-4-deoxy-L-arabinose transferase-like glycosyltransferase